jgi:transcriptional regulator with XRE-family HTH domain
MEIGGRLPYVGGMNVHPKTAGAQLREWRQRRRLSQLDLACEAQISARHLSFLETGRSQPSREMILRLAEQLEIPVRERNALLVAAGYAPVFQERPLKDPALAPARAAIEAVLEGHKPYPAFAVDRHWKVIASNAALPELYVDVAPELMEQPINAMRISLHPRGVAPRIANFSEWRAHLLSRLMQQIDVSGDPVLVELLRELSGYAAPNGDDRKRIEPLGTPDIVVPFRVIVDDVGLLSFFTTTTVFGTPVDITLSEIALECFYPADNETAERMQALAARRQK